MELVHQNNNIKIPAGRSFFLTIPVLGGSVYTDMATIQRRSSRGHTYWAIVESRRVNGKPRPIVLEHLGTAEALLQRLTEGVPKKVRSYVHGDVVFLLELARRLKIVETINRHVPHPRLRDGFTVGGSLLLAAIGRICHPTSKRNWYEGWARGTSLALLLRMSLSKLDSQHFWDQMDALPCKAIAQVEHDIVTTLCESEGVSLDTLVYDTTNFFTYIDSTNTRCSLAQRGKNKQRRMDLRQLGLLLLVSRDHRLPLLHTLYQGNLQDRSVFKEALPQIISRFKAICGSLEDLTMVFDQGNNSKKILHSVEKDLHFVAALSPSHHKKLIEEANASMTPLSVRGKDMTCYRSRQPIWGLDLTYVVYISEKLRDGQIRGIERNLTKVIESLQELESTLSQPTTRGRKRTREGIEKRIHSLLSSHDLKAFIGWDLKVLHDDAFELRFWIEQDNLETFIQQRCGRRILITTRHDWSTQEIILSYWGQADVEYAFKNLKNPFHMAFRPQYHWTDQKIQVHALICFIGLVLYMLAYKKARNNAGYKGSPEHLIEKLSQIRLATFVEAPPKKSRGSYKTVYSIEEMEEDIALLAHGLGITELPLKTAIPFSVYT